MSEICESARKAAQQWFEEGYAPIVAAYSWTEEDRADLEEYIQQAVNAETRRMVNKLAELGAELTRLRELEAALPKCWRITESGELKQDVPIIPGMTIYAVRLRDEHDWEQEPVAAIETCAASLTSPWIYNPEDCYAEREHAQVQAARQARREVTHGPQ